MPRVLIAEDEQAIADAVLYALRSEGLEAEHCLLGEQALQRLQAGDIDVLVLDVGLPDRSGFEVCRALRRFSQIPVIFLTARDGEIDRVLGLELGADDYVTKPFSPRELVARVRARLRRAAPGNGGGDANGNGAGDGDATGGDGWIARGAFAIDAEGHRIRYRGTLLDLTRYEQSLLSALLQRPGAILTRAQLLDRGWDAGSDSGDRTIDTHIKTLRAKLRAAGAPSDPIRTHRGLGYSLDA